MPEWLLHERRSQHEEGQQQYSYVTHRRHIDERTFLFYFRSAHNRFIEN